MKTLDVQTVRFSPQNQTSFGDCMRANKAATTFAKAAPNRQHGGLYPRPPSASQLAVVLTVFQYKGVASRALGIAGQITLEQAMPSARIRIRPTSMRQTTFLVSNSESFCYGMYSDSFCSVHRLLQFPPEWFVLGQSQEHNHDHSLAAVRCYLWASQMPDHVQNNDTGTVA